MFLIVSVNSSGMVHFFSGFSLSMMLIREWSKMFHGSMLSITTFLPIGFDFNVLHVTGINQLHTLTYILHFVFLQVGTAMTNALINAKKAVKSSSEGEIENVPILSTSAAYGVYMSISSNLR